MQSALAEYNRNSSLKHIINKVRRDPQTFPNYHHNRELVAFVNLFADKRRDLPPRWDIKRSRGSKVGVSCKKLAM